MPVEDFHDLHSLTEWEVAAKVSLARSRRARMIAARRRRERIGAALCVLAVVVVVVMFGLPR